MKPNNETPEINIKGVALKCNFKTLDDKNKYAQILIFTPFPNHRDIGYDIPYIANVIVIPAENEKDFERLQQSCQKNSSILDSLGGDLDKEYAFFTKPEGVDYISVDGKLIGAKKPQANTIYAKLNDVSFPEYIDFTKKREKAIKGKIVKCNKTSSYASLMVEIENKDKKNILIPVTMNQKNNPENWLQIQNQLKEGTNIKVKGLVETEQYISHDTKMNITGIVARKIQVLEPKKKIAKTDSKTEIKTTTKHI